jgi:hypothetical protein
MIIDCRLGTYSAAAATIPPAAVVAARAMAADPRAEPRYGERVAYVVVAGPPNARLVDLVRLQCYFNSGVLYTCPHKSARCSLCDAGGDTGACDNDTCTQVVSPQVLVEAGGRLRLNALYYINNQILPALERVLSLVRRLDVPYSPFHSVIISFAFVIGNEMVYLYSRSLMQLLVALLCVCQACRGELDENFTNTSFTPFAFTQ